jgi:hypothetical protein
LAVGDQSFQKKCLAHIESLKSSGVTIVFVSHNLDTVRDLCERALWLNEGILREDGPSERVIEDYLQAVQKKEIPQGEAAEARTPEPPSTPPMVMESVGREMEDKKKERMEKAPKKQRPMQPKRWGSRDVEITHVRFLDPSGQVYEKLPAGNPVIIDILYEAREPIDDVVFGIAIHRCDGLHISGTNTSLDAFPIPKAQGQGHMQYRIDGLPLQEGSYRLSVAIHRDDMSRVYDYQAFAHPFEVTCEEARAHEGIIDLEGTWKHRTHVEETTEEIDA